MAKKNTTKKRTTKPYYQKEGLSIDGLLKKFDYLPESPRFHTLGIDFIDNYSELKELVKKRRAESTIVKKDKFLVELFKKVLRNFYLSMPDEEKKEIMKEWLEITKWDGETKVGEIVMKNWMGIKDDEKPEKKWNAAAGDRQLYEIPESKEEKKIKQDNQEILTNSLYYQVDGLQIDEELKKCDHLPNSPKFYALGMDFVNGYNHLIGMVETGIDENIIREKDQELIGILKAVFENMANPTIDNLGNIPEIIINLSKEHKSLLPNTMLMVKNCTSHVDFYAIGHNSAPLLMNGKPKKYTIEQLRGSSEIITNENFLRAFANLRAVNKNAVFFLFLEDIQDIDKTHVKVRLYNNGQQDMKFGEKLFENWIVNKR